MQATYEASSDKNIVSSPLGLMTLLSLYNVGAGSGAKSEITSFLGGTDFQKVRRPEAEQNNLDSSHLE